jgi:hypothetical protein
MKKQLKVPRGKDLLTVAVSGHSYLSLADEAGTETFRSDSPTRHINVSVSPGRYVVETDGKIQKLQLTALEPRLRAPRQLIAEKPPRMVR